MAEPESSEDGRDRAWRRLLRSARCWISSDELLTGFTATESRAPEIRTFFVSTISAALVAWDVAFNLGAFHTLFFTRRHQLAVVLFVVVLGVIVLRRQVHVHWWLLVILATPMIWVFFRLLVPRDRSNEVIDTIDGGFLVAMVMLYPIVFWIVLRLVAPDYFAIPNLRLKIASVAIVLALATLGYAVGELNYRFLSCSEFAVSGSDLPVDCADG
jgi:hypothetical protein